jgi:hypothetical protein
LFVLLVLGVLNQYGFKLRKNLALGVIVCAVPG